jgi:hypothetical protein
MIVYFVEIFLGQSIQVWRFFHDHKMNVPLNKTIFQTEIIIISHHSRLCNQLPAIENNKLTSRIMFKNVTSTYVDSPVR